MTDKRWEFELDGAKHSVELEHKHFSNKLSIRVDGRLLSVSPQAQQPKGSNSKYLFRIDSHACEVLISRNYLKFAYDLVLDGISNMPENMKAQNHIENKSQDTITDKRLISRSALLLGTYLLAVLYMTGPSSSLGESPGVLFNLGFYALAILLFPIGLALFLSNLLEPNTFAGIEGLIAYGIYWYIIRTAIMSESRRLFIFLYVIFIIICIMSVRGCQQVTF